MSSSAAKTKPLIHRWVGFLVACLILLTSVEAMQTKLSDPHCAGADFYQFWLVGQAMTKTTEHPVNVYDPETRSMLNKFGHVLAGYQPQSKRLAIASSARAQIETFSSPFLYTLFTFRSTGDYDTDLGRYRSFCLFLALGSILYFARAAGFGLTMSVMWVALVVQGCWPLMIDAFVGNVNVLQLTAIAIYLALNPARDGIVRNILAGTVIGMLVMFKPTIVFVPALLGLSWALFGQWEKLAAQAVGAMTGGILAVFMSLRLFPIESWTQWTNAVRNLSALDTIGVMDGNLAPSRFANDIGFHVPAGLFLLIVAGAVVACLVNARFRTPDASPSQTRRRDALLVGLGLCVALVGTELAWVHYFLLTLPLMFVLLESWPAHVPWHTLRASIVLFAAVLIFGTPIEYFWPLSMGMTAIVCFLGTITMMALGCFELATPVKAE